MRKDLLAAAYHLIQRIPEKDIDMNHWVKTTPNGGSCGTVACAAGHMAVSGTFRAEGLKLIKGKSGNLQPAYIGNIGPKFLGLTKRYVGSEALAKLLEISEPEAWNLFEYIQVNRGSHKQVFLDRMEAFAKKHGISLEVDSRDAGVIASEAINKAAGISVQGIRENTSTSAR